MEHSSANSVISFIITNLVAQFKHMESLILGDPGEVSRDDRMFVLKVYRKTFTTNILSSRLIAPRSSRLRISETKIHSKNNLRWQIIKQNDAELSVIYFFFSNWDYSHTNYRQKRWKYWVLTIYIGRLEFLPGKSNGSHRYLLESSENVDFVLRRSNFLLLSDFSSDFDILCSELFSHHD